VPSSATIVSRRYLLTLIHFVSYLLLIGGLLLSLHLLQNSKEPEMEISFIITSVVRYLTGHNSANAGFASICKPTRPADALRRYDLFLLK
jgi:hypothetical protein